MNQSVNNRVKEFPPEVIDDIIGWDIDNWKRALELWNDLKIDFNGKMTIAVGEQHGGLTLWLALQDGNKVYSTDINGVTPLAKELHQRYNVTDKITYENADLLNLHYGDNTFDVLVFKSVLGGLREFKKQQRAMEEVYRVLKPGGWLLFAENTTATPVHMMLRRFFSQVGAYWRYMKINELLDMLKSYSEVLFTTYGFFGTFGRNESQRKILAGFDKKLDKIIPRKNKYIFMAACRK